LTGIPCIVQAFVENANQLSESKAQVADYLGGTAAFFYFVSIPVAFLSTADDSNGKYNGQLVLQVFLHH